MSEKILVIEDNPANLELMVYLLRAFGYTACTALDGEAGLAAAFQEQPDLVICDIQLPRLDGCGVVRRLKADAACAGIPVIAVTALAMVGDEDRLLSAGFDGYLSKPIDPETFVGQVEKFLQGSERRGSPVAARPEPALDGPRYVRTGARILVVDNVPANLLLARSILEPSGYEIITAASGNEAFAAAIARVPDLIVSDICMQNGNGYDFFRLVKATPELAAIPFIFLTSTMLEEEDRKQGLAMGADGYLFRPIEPEDFLKEIEARLG